MDTLTVQLDAQSVRLEITDNHQVYGITTDEAHYISNTVSDDVINSELWKAQIADYWQSDADIRRRAARALVRRVSEGVC